MHQIDIKDIHSRARATVEANKYRWAHNAKRNIGPDRIQFDEIEGDWTGFEVVLVGFGPSLEQHVKLLRNIDRTRFKIVCVDVSFTYLIDNGIIPDAMFNADALVQSERVFGKDMEYVKYTEDVMLCAFQATNPDLVEHWLGPKCLFLTLDMVDFWRVMHKYTQNKNALCSGGNVSTCAFSFITDIMEAKRLILLGMEHAWYDWGNRYAGHHDTDGRKPGKKQFKSKKKKLCKTKDYQGKECYSDREYTFYARWFDQMAGKCKKNVYDCSRGGLLGAGYIKKANAAEMLDGPFMENEYDVKAWIDMATRKLKPDLQELVTVYSGPNDLTTMGRVWDDEFQHEQILKWYEMNRLGNGITTKILRDNRYAIISKDVRYDIDADIGFHWNMDRIKKYVRRVYNAS